MKKIFKKIGVVYITLFCFLIISFTPNAFPLKQNNIVTKKESSQINQQIISTFDNDEWPLFRHDAVNSGTSTSSAPNTNEINWFFNTNHFVFGSPVVQDNLLFLGTYGLDERKTLYPFSYDFSIGDSEYEDGKLFCLDARIGTERWEKSLGCMFASPAVSQENVYVSAINATTQQNQIFCLSEETGVIKWAYPLEYYSYSPIIVNDKVYISSTGEYARIDCLNATTGEVIWSNNSFSMILCAPAITDGKIFFPDNRYEFNFIHCFNADTGDHIWTEPVDTIETYSVAVAYESVFVMGSGDEIPTQILSSFSSSTGTPQWDIPLGVNYVQEPTYPTMAIYGNKIYSITSDVEEISIIHCVDAFLGYPLWEKEYPGGSMGSPSIADGKLYYANVLGDMLCINATDGHLVWQGFIGGYGTLSSPAICDGHVFISAVTGSILSFGPSYIPTAPSIAGPNRGRVKAPCEYTFVSTDAQNDEVYYFIDWGDDTNSGWIGPYDSGQEIQVSHTWDKRGTYTIRAKAKDIFSYESKWGTFEVSMPKDFISWWYSFLCRFFQCMQ